MLPGVENIADRNSPSKPSDDLKFVPSACRVCVQADLCVHTFSLLHVREQMDFLWDIHCLWVFERPMESEQELRNAALHQFP